eukprot:288520-Chlamydomonas_euryale.AAC.1
MHGPPSTGTRGRAGSGCMGHRRPGQGAGQGRDAWATVDRDKGEGGSGCSNTSCMTRTGRAT